MIDPATQKQLDALLEDVVSTFAGDLRSVALYGSAAGGDFVPGRSRLDLAIVLSAIRFAHLAALRSRLPRWHALGAATPLLVDPAFLARGLDVFPMEFLDIQARHRTLWGSECFVDLRIDPAHLRFQLEQEARGKLLRLRLAFAETPDPGDGLGALLLASVKSFVAMLRCLLRVGGHAVPARQREVVAAFERVYRLQLPALQEVLAAKLADRPPAAPVEGLFERYLADVERLVDLVDRSDATQT